MLTEVAPKIENKIPYEPADLFLSVYAENWKQDFEDILHIHVHSSIILNIQEVYQPKYLLMGDG